MTSAAELWARRRCWSVSMTTSRGRPMTSAAELVRRLSDVAQVCDELGVEVELLSVSEWRMNVHVSSEEQVDALADRFGLGPAGDGFNYQRDAGLFGPLIVYSRRSRSCACGQRCDHGAPS